MTGPFVIFLIILAPVFISIILLVPIYAGVFLSSYILYDPEGDAANPIWAVKYNIFEVFGLYMKLFDYWKAYSDQLAWSFPIHLFLYPTIGTLIAIFVLINFHHMMKNVFES